MPKAHPPKHITPHILAARSDDELATILLKHQNSLVCVMLGSSWCPHCHDIFPELYRVSKQFPANKYVVAQLEYLDKAAQGIRYTPTFRFYHKGRRINEFLADNGQQVKDHVWLYSADAAAAAGDTDEVAQSLPS